MNFVPFHRLSTLVARQAHSEFTSRPDTIWVVWEAGSWMPAQPSQEGTAPRTPGVAKDVQTADALVFELVPSAQANRFVIGRSRTCEVLINDATVSRSHLVVSHGPKGWQVALAADGKQATFHGAPLHSAAVPLSSGQRAEIGSALLTFLDGGAMTARLRKEATVKKARR